MRGEDNNEPTRRKKGGPRGSVRNADRLSDFGNGRGGGSADWGDCDCKWIQAVVAGLARLGGAVTFGLSRDGGAHFLTLMLDDNRKTLWFNGDADLDDQLRDVVAMLEAMD